ALLGAEAQPEIVQRIAAYPGVGRRRRIGGEVGAIAAVVTKICLPFETEQGHRQVGFRAERKRPFGHARQALAGYVAIGGTEAAWRSRSAWRLPSAPDGASR